MRQGYILGAIIIGSLLGVPLDAQEPVPARYTVTADHAVVVAKDVLVRHGFRIIRIEKKGPAITVYYRRGNMGRGRGQGPPMRFVIRQVGDGVVFQEAPATLLIDIDVRLKLP